MDRPPPVTAGRLTGSEVVTPAVSLRSPLAGSGRHRRGFGQPVIDRGRAHWERPQTCFPLVEDTAIPTDLGPDPWSRWPQHLGGSLGYSTDWQHPGGGRPGTMAPRI